MSAEKLKCSRCGEPAESRDNLAETTFWGFIETTTETVTTKVVRIASTYIRGHGIDSRVLTSDEKRSLCSPCWGLLVGRFFQGRDVAAVDHEHEWKRGGRSGGYPLERCGLCLRDRIAVSEERTET